MERMLVVTFDNENIARKASAELERLAERSVIALNAASIVTKSPEGIATVTAAHDPAPSGAMGGTAIGSLIGIVGYGGIGLLVGGTAGLVAGVVADWARARVGRDFVADVADALDAGKVALVAQIDEEDTDQVDVRMKMLGVITFRRPFADVTDDELESETVKRALSRVRR